MSNAPGSLTLQKLQSVDDQLVLTWADGVEHRLTWKILRKACPCATCLAAEEKQQAASSTPAEADSSVGVGGDLLTILPIEETKPVKAVGMQPLGHYAYRIDFSDGHNTGLFTLEYLRALGEEAARRGSASA